MSFSGLINLLAAGGKGSGLMLEWGEGEGQGLVWVINHCLHHPSDGLPWLLGGGGGGTSQCTRSPSGPWVESTHEKGGKETVSSGDRYLKQKRNFRKTLLPSTTLGQLHYFRTTFNVHYSSITVYVIHVFTTVDI